MLHLATSTSPSDAGLRDGSLFEGPVRLYFRYFRHALFNHQAKDNINYYLFAWAHVIDATYVNRRVGAMQPYAEK